MKKAFGRSGSLTKLNWDKHEKCENNHNQA